MAAPTVYQSTDASAPVLSGQANALIDLLKACLVDGYGAKAAAGWTEAYTDTGISCLRQGAGLSHYLRVVDTDAQMSRVRGYESMSAHSTGTGDFPTVAQVASDGLYLRKSITADSTSRAWTLFATDKQFYLIVHGATSGADFTSNGGTSTMAFGELLTTNQSTDTVASFLIAGTDTSTSSTTATPNRQPVEAIGVQLTGHYMARSHSGSGTAVQFGKYPLANASLARSGATSGGFAFPEATSGAFELGYFAVIEGAATAQVHRGYLAGLFCSCHSSATSTLEPHRTIAGHGDYEGETFAYERVGANSAVVVQTSGGW